MESYIVDTFSLTQYSYEVDQLPRLNAEEVAALGQRILQANEGQMSWAEGMTARDALVQGHLYLVLTLAQRYPWDLRDDLVQEGNIGLMEAVEYYDFPEGGDFIAYATVAIRHAIANAMAYVLPIRIPRTSLRVAKQRGTADKLYAMQPISLEKPLQHDTTMCLADTLPAPESTAAEESEQEQHTHASVQTLDALLDTLPGMTRVVIELRYGLDEEDQREHSYAQIADKLGISRMGACKLEHSGLSILQGKRIQRDQLRHMAQESRLHAAYALLQQARRRISSRQLARAARVSDDAAAAYLERIKQADSTTGKAETSALGEKTYTKLLHAYHHLQEQNLHINVQRLSETAQVNWRTAKKFLDHRAQLHAQQLEQTNGCREAVEA
ncbi:MAG TPA: sigma-70 family RNA polymerase sigma factor [Ktedonobacteraceae bacterium]|nr:sigma-70 family RNA polymerase sigma factor [Ktedonobacteraceae bacterium]